MSNKLGKVLFSKQELNEMCQRLGKQITADYAGKEVLVIGVLRGAFVFMADLVREIDLPCTIDFIAVSSYGSSTTSSGVVKIVKDINQNIEGKDVIIVEDIIDTGLTLKKLTELLETRNPNSIELCTAFDKPARCKVEIDVKYRGIEIPDEFVIGYGLDYAEKYRNLPELYVVNPEEVMNE